MCPHCGYNLEADKPLVSGCWLIGPQFLWRNSERISLTKSEAAAVHTVANARGGYILPAVIGERVTSADNPNNAARVYINRAKRKAPGLPIVSDYGRGYRWAGQTPVAFEMANA